MDYYDLMTEATDGHVRFNYPKIARRTPMIATIHRYIEDGDEEVDVRVTYEYTPEEAPSKHSRGESERADVIGVDPIEYWQQIAEDPEVETACLEDAARRLKDEKAERQAAEAEAWS